jgi:undecaprenyl-diphosphatase
MTDFQAIVMGIVQGASEWLPISSVAHMSIVRALLGWHFDKTLFTAFKAVVQWGAVFAAIVYFRNDIRSILFGWKDPKAHESDGIVSRKLLLPIVIGTLPIALAGLVFHKLIEKWSDNLYASAAGLIIFAFFLWAAEARHIPRRKIGSISIIDGLLIGIGQTFALIPGVSRSGSTITSGLAVGLERVTATRYSFLLGLPAFFLAGLFELIKHRHDIIASHLGRPMAVATITSFIFGYAIIDWFMKYLRTHPTMLFVIYRIVLGVFLLIMLANHLIH